MDKFEQIKAKYKKRKTWSVAVIVAGALAFALSILFIFVETGNVPPPVWNQYHIWAVGLGCVLVTVGGIWLATNLAALRDIEKTASRLNPDERELAILQKAQSITFKIYTLVVFPIVFMASSILLMLDHINFVAWILIIAAFLAMIITYAIVRRNQEGKF